jgi:sugar/nucleoside kinase (ribokinase family)
LNYIVIGEPCVDFVIKKNGDTFKSYGGITYSLIAMSVLADKNDFIYPIMNVGEDEYDNIVSLLSVYSNIDISGINKINFPTRQVKLDYTDTTKPERQESSTKPMPGIKFEKIQPFLELTDALLINMVSGVDITLDTMKQIKNNFAKNIHLDAHNLVMQTHSDGKRTYTHNDDWLEWCTNVTTLQMNEHEINVLTKDKKKEYHIAEEILINSGKGVKGLVVTRGAGGLSGYTKKEKSFNNEKFTDLDKEDIGAIENPHYLDATGCGDVFASAFTLDYSKNNDFIKSMHYANRIASYKTSLQGTGDLKKLK